MKEEKNELNDSKLDKSMKKLNESNEVKEPIYKMTIESEKGRKEIINIYPNSKPEEIAYNFCKENNLDFKTLELMISKVKILIETMAKKKDLNEKENINSENDKKIIFCNEPILEDSEEQQSLSTEKIKKTISFKEKILQNMEKEKENAIDNDNRNDINNNNNSNENDNNLVLNYFKINEDFKEKKIINSKTSSVITNTINNCLELIEKEEKYFVSSSSTFSSKLGSSSFQNQNFSIIIKVSINLMKISKNDSAFILNPIIRGI